MTQPNFELKPPEVYQVAFFVQVALKSQIKPNTSIKGFTFVKKTLNCTCTKLCKGDVL